MKEREKMCTVKKIGAVLVSAAVLGTAAYLIIKCDCFNKNVLKRKIRNKITLLERALENADRFVVKM